MHCTSFSYKKLKQPKASILSGPKRKEINECNYIVNMNVKEMNKQVLRIRDVYPESPSRIPDPHQRV